MTETRVEFWEDTCTINPLVDEDWPGAFYFGHRTYDLGGVRLDDMEEWNGTVEDALKRGDNVVYVYMQDHSGLAFSLSDFNDPWDSGTIGFIVVDREHTEEDAMNIAQGMVYALNNYFNGKVWGFTTFDKDDEVVESVGGFFGDDIETNGILDYIPLELQEDTIEKWEEMKWSV